jgi:molybdopterin molybdotransferase
MKRPVVEVAEAARLIESHLPRLPVVERRLSEAAGYILAEPILATRDQPSYDRVMMDGVAIDSRAWKGGRRLFGVAGTAAAGSGRLRLEDSAMCIEVMTGAVLPEGADCVVPVEDLDRRQDGVELGDTAEAAPGRHVHRRASDQPAGAVLLEAGTRLRGPELAIAAATGLARLPVSSRPRITVITTGDELIQPGQPAEDHQIWSSNEYGLTGLMMAHGAGDIGRRRLADDREQTRDGIASALATSEVVVLSGGVSRGRFDYVPDALADLGVTRVFHRVAQRPGKPMWFGVSPEGRPVFALPGNPVSTLVCCRRYVVPALRRMQGETEPPSETCRLAGEVVFEPDLELFLPVRVRVDPDGTLEAHPRPTNTSGDYASLAGTSGFAALPRGQARYPTGYMAHLLRW